MTRRDDPIKMIWDIIRIVAAMIIGFIVIKALLSVLNNS